MFQCIACSKQAIEEGEEQVRKTETVTGTESSTVKSLTSQFKEMALKFTGAKQSKSMGEYENNCEGVQGIGGGSNQIQRRNEPVAPEVVDGDESIMWIAQVEPGIHITFVPLSTGGNDLRRVRFNREVYDRWQAQRWWLQNFDRIMELYNVQRFNRQALNTPRNSEDELRDTPPVSRQPSGRDGRDSPVASALLNNDSTLRNVQFYDASEVAMDQGTQSQSVNAAGSSNLSNTSFTDELSFVNENEIDADLIEQDEPGVFFTIRQFPDGTKDLRRIRFSRQRFGADDAKQWWEDNKERILAQYL